MTSLNIKLAFFFFSLTLSQLSFTFATPISETVAHRILRGLFPKTHIEIVNSLGDGIQAKVMCRSNMNDYQDALINDGQSFQFGFTPSLFLKVWHCELMYWNNDAIGNLYHYPQDWHRCFKHCKYVIARDGVHRFSKDGIDEIFLKWE